MDKKSTPEQQGATEELKKSIDTLLDRVDFMEGFQKGSGIDISGDSSTTADAVLAKVESSENDENRGAGRPKQISDVPKTDTDGARGGEYDSKISSNDDKEDEPDETKQSPAIDQVSEKGRMKASPAKRPDMAPFKKSYDRFMQFLAFEELSKSEATEEVKAEPIEKAEKVIEPLVKSEKSPEMVSMTKAEHETLLKASTKVAEAAVEPLVKSGVELQMETLQKGFDEQSALLKAMSKIPNEAKSIQSIQTLEKSADSSGMDSQVSPSEMMDAAEDLCKSNKLPVEAVAELESTGTLYDVGQRKVLEDHLRAR